MSQPKTDLAGDINQAARQLNEARTTLGALLAAACPGPHVYSQRGGGKGPWCPACRYTVNGEKVAG